ncbi:MAG: hypothetical protein SH808_12375 [Saprospiraceae bacterium]|nr:hypothetical protein [Saprospiraceae bacterium]
MKKEVYLEQFAEEVNHYHGLMQEAFEGVIDEGVSNYPVFIFHQQEVSVGLPIVDRHQIAGEWSVNISTLEEFYIKGLVVIEKVEEIKAKIIGHPPQYCCLVLVEGKGSLIFLPRESSAE